MSSKKISNVSLSLFRRFLLNVGCKLLRTNVGHEIWFKPGLTRPITFQTHISPVPEFIIKNALRTLELSKDQFWNILEQ